MSAAPILNVVGVTNTKLAACLWSLGFAWKGDLVQGSKGGNMAVQFLFHGTSQRPEYAELNLRQMVREHEAKTLDPMHPLAVMMLAQHNYDRLLDMMKKGLPHRLCSQSGGRLFIYRPGDEHPTMMHAVDRVQASDLALVAALSLVGLPVIRITGDGDGYRFDLPRLGYLCRIGGETSRQEDARQLMLRAATKEDPLKLALETIAPNHPVVLAYDALHARAALKKMIEKKTPLLLIEQSGGPKQALVTMNSQGRVMQQVEKHLKAPPLKWK